MAKMIDYGIDLGTTNSCIAKWESGSTRVFKNNSQMNITPSLVHLMKNGRIMVGQRATSSLLTDPDNVAVEFKRWMGQKDKKEFPAAQKSLSAEELSAEVLKSLKEDVKRQNGEDIRAAVITVPAAFGALQCEATARAATFAGLEMAPLLQEPIAAAIGYGVGGGQDNERWLVFDFGGGTLDIAVISTKGGRLSVMEHRGNNFLGGKDIDRSIIENILIPEIANNFKIDTLLNSNQKNSFYARLRVKAEEAKIDLSTEKNVIMSLFDIGDDDEGRPIEIDIGFSQSQLQKIVEPIFEKCLALTDEAIEGARIKGSDLNKILLVGGSTQSPMLRQALKDRVGADVDFSIDPMTVVGCGAAVYASTIEIPNLNQVSANNPTNDQLSLKLAYEPISFDRTATVAGRLSDDTIDLEVKIDAENGTWSSGWLRTEKGLFETKVILKESDVNIFWVYVRDQQGKLVETDLPEFKIRHGLIPSAAPLPHTLSVEILSTSGKALLDPVFTKGAPLPAQKTLKYRATRALSPNDPESNIAIKLWEGEFFDDPEANEWVGNVVISHESVIRTVPEGAEIEVTLEINSSRLISVEAFIPHLNKSFSDKLYIPQREQHDFSKLASKVSLEAEDFRIRFEKIEIDLASVVDSSTELELQEIKTEIKRLETLSATNDAKSGAVDPDDARRLVDESKNVRGRLSRLEKKSEKEKSQNISLEILNTVEPTEEVVTQFGSSLDKQQLSMLKRELEKSFEKNDGKSIQRICDEITSLRWRTLFKHDWFWRDILLELSDPSNVFVDDLEARRQIERGTYAIQNADSEELKASVRALWELQPKGNSDMMKENMIKSGLRRY